MITATVRVDVGGTKIAAGVVDRSGTILATEHRPTPEDDAGLVCDTIADMARDLRRRHEVSAVGVAAAGFVDEARSTILFAPNLPWRDEPLRDRLQARTGLPVVVENDANAAAWGEFQFGAGRGENHIVGLTVGTGIGGGIVANGALVRGRFGVAAEVGHVVMVPAGRPCHCGLRGCLEQYASGNALARRAQEIASEAPWTARRLLARADGRPDRITGVMVTEAAREGDTAALRALTRSADGSAAGWRNWRRFSTRESSFWPVAWSMPGSSSSHRRSTPSGRTSPV
jgi:glucokinase